MSRFMYLKMQAERRALLLTKRAVGRVTDIGRQRSSKCVIFVTGVQRSGTNMMMDVFERSFETDVYHESDSRAFVDFEMRSQREIEALVSRSRSRLVVIKALCEMDMLRDLLARFAPARAIWLLRHYHDVVNSHVKLWTTMPGFIAAIVKDRNAAEWRGRGMSDATLEIVRRVYRENLDNASACALFWYFRNRLYFEHHLDKDDRVLLIQYEKLVAEPETEFPKIFRFVDVKPKPRLWKRVHRRSVSKSSAPNIDSEIEELCNVLWRQLIVASGL